MNIIYNHISYKLFCFKKEIVMVYFHGNYSKIYKIENSREIYKILRLDGHLKLPSLIQPIGTEGHSQTI